jgi:hypothetical protein
VPSARIIDSIADLPRTDKVRNGRRIAPQQQLSNTGHHKLGARAYCIVILGEFDETGTPPGLLKADAENFKTLGMISGPLTAPDQILAFLPVSFHRLPLFGERKYKFGIDGVS